MDQLKNSAQNKPDILYVLKSFRFFLLNRTLTAMVCREDLVKYMESALENGI